MKVEYFGGEPTFTFTNMITSPDIARPEVDVVRQSFCEKLIMLERKGNHGSIDERDLKPLTWTGNSHVLTVPTHTRITDALDEYAERTEDVIGEVLYTPAIFVATPDFLVVRRSLGEFAITLADEIREAVSAIQGEDQISDAEKLQAEAERAFQKMPHTPIDDITLDNLLGRNKPTQTD